MTTTADRQRGRLEKRCPSCRIVKPREDYWANIAQADGLQVYCKPCDANINVERRDRYSYKPADGRHCARCKQWKNATHFHRNRRVPSGLAAYCKDCAADYGRERRKQLAAEAASS